MDAAAKCMHYRSDDKFLSSISSVRRALSSTRACQVRDKIDYSDNKYSSHSWAKRTASYQWTVPKMWKHVRARSSTEASNENPMSKNHLVASVKLILGLTGNPWQNAPDDRIFRIHSSISAIRIFVLVPWVCFLSNNGRTHLREEYRILSKILLWNRDSH